MITLNNTTTHSLTFHPSTRSTKLLLHFFLLLIRPSVPPADGEIPDCKENHWLLNAPHEYSNLSRDDNFDSTFPLYSIFHAYQHRHHHHHNHHQASHAYPITTVSFKTYDDKDLISSFHRKRRQRQTRDKINNSSNRNNSPNVNIDSESESAFRKTTISGNNIKDKYGLQLKRSDIDVDDDIDLPINNSFADFQKKKLENRVTSKESKLQPLTSAKQPQLCCHPGHEVIIVPLIFCLIAVAGCFGNILVIAVVFKNRNQLSNTTNTFIVNLAVADLIFLVFCIPFHAVFYSSTTNWPLGSHVCKFVHYLQFSSMITSVWTLVLMSLDRFLAVAYPVQTKHLRTSRSALVVCLIIWFASLMSAIPIGMAYRVRVYTHNLNLLGGGYRQNVSRLEEVAIADGTMGSSKDLLRSITTDAVSNFTLTRIHQPSTRSMHSWHVTLPSTYHVGESDFSTRPSANRSRGGYLINTTLCAEYWGRANSKRAYFAFLLTTSYVIPLLFIGGLNCATIGYLWRGSFDMGPNQQGRSTEAKRRGTKLIVAIVIVFALMWMPSHVVWMWTIFFKSSWKNTYFFFYFKLFAHVSSYANSCVNPAVYAFLSTRFRRELRGILPCSRRRPKTTRNARFTFTTAGKCHSQQELNRLSQLRHQSHNHHYHHHHNHQHHHNNLKEGIIYHTMNHTMSTTTISSVAAFSATRRNKNDNDDTPTTVMTNEVCRDCSQCCRQEESKTSKSKGLRGFRKKNKPKKLAETHLGCSLCNSTLSLTAMKINTATVARSTGASQL